MCPHICSVFNVCLLHSVVLWLTYSHNRDGMKSPIRYIRWAFIFAMTYKKTFVQSYLERRTSDDFDCNCNYNRDFLSAEEL